MNFIAEYNIIDNKIEIREKLLLLIIGKILDNSFTDIPFFYRILLKN